MGRQNFKYIIIGSGVAGKTAALMAAKAGIKTAVVGFKDRSGLTAKVKELSDAGVTCIHGRARFVNNHEIIVGDKHFTGEKFLIATGSEPADSLIKGIETVKCLTPKNALKSNTVSKAVFVIGAGSCGLEIAQHFAKLGTKVILAEAKDYLLPREDNEVGRFMEKYLTAKNKIRVLTKARVVRLEENDKSKRVFFVQDGREKSVRVDTIVLATGTKPAIDLDLEKAKIKVVNGHIVVNGELQTSAKNIWVAGGAVSGESSIERAVYEATVVTSNIITKGKAIANYSGFMRMTNTFPQVAKVGMNESECRSTKCKVKTILVPLSKLEYVKDDKVGFLKLLVDKKGMVVGATAVMPEANLALQELSLAIRYGLSAREIASTPHVASNWGDAVRLATKKLVKK